MGITRKVVIKCVCNAIRKDMCNSEVRAVMASGNYEVCTVLLPPKLLPYNFPEKKTTKVLAAQESPERFWVVLFFLSF